MVFTANWKTSVASLFNGVALGAKKSVKFFSEKVVTGVSFLNLSTKNVLPAPGYPTKIMLRGLGKVWLGSFRGRMLSSANTLKFTTKKIQRKNGTRSGRKRAILNLK